MKRLFILAIAVMISGCGGGGASNSGGSSPDHGEDSPQSKVENMEVVDEDEEETTVSFAGSWGVSRNGRRNFSNPIHNRDINTVHEFQISSDGIITPKSETDELCGFDMHDSALIDSNNEVSYQEFGKNCVMDAENCIKYGRCNQVGEVCSVNTWMDLTFNGNTFVGELTEGVNCNGQGSFAITDLVGTRR